VAFVVCEVYYFAFDNEGFFYRVKRGYAEVFALYYLAVFAYVYLRFVVEVFLGVGVFDPIASPF